MVKVSICFASRRPRCTPTKPAVGPASESYLFVLPKAPTLVTSQQWQRIVSWPQPAVIICRHVFKATLATLG